jgi:hypothetical protein
VVLLVAFLLTVVDVLAGLRRIVRYFVSIWGKKQPFAFRVFWRSIVLAKEETSLHELGEYMGLAHHDQEGFEGENESKEAARPSDSGMDGQWVNYGPSTYDKQIGSPTSEHTVYSMNTPKDSQNSCDTLIFHASAAKKHGILAKIGSAFFKIAERALVFAAFSQVLEGIVVYTGGCRGNYLNGCLAHLISEFHVKYGWSSRC